MAKSTMRHLIALTSEIGKLYKKDLEEVAVFVDRELAARRSKKISKKNGEGKPDDKAAL